MPPAELLEQFSAVVKAIADEIHHRIPPCFEMDDLIQEGWIGLLDADARYDPANGVPFAAYARFRIRGAMLDSLRRSTWFNGTMSGFDQGEGREMQIADTRRDLDVEGQLGAARQRRLLAVAIAQLPPRERAVVVAHYQDSQSLLDAGRQLGVNNSRACQIHDRALSRLRAMPQARMAAEK
jgi:RNA polymerase sigma factor FliA